MIKCNLTKKINWRNYLLLNLDLNQNANKTTAISHYLNYGIKENRLYDINLPHDFKWKIYLNLNCDLNQNADKTTTILHYLNHGIKENRQYKIANNDLNQTHNKHFCDTQEPVFIPEKEHVFFDTPEQVFIPEKEHVFFDTPEPVFIPEEEHVFFDTPEPVFIPEEEEPKICIVYVYYERKNEQKNQTNLSFFLKYGLDKSRWKNMNITTLLIINNYQCELLIPKMENLHIYYNISERDISSYKKGIEYFENIYNKPFYESFTHLFILNSSVLGPIYEEGLDRHWLFPFLNNLTDNTVLCSPCINFLRKEDGGGPGPRGQTYCSLIKINKHIYELLLYTKISNLAQNTTNTNYLLEYDYIFGEKNNIENAILIGEYGLSRILLDNGYNISCLIYNKIEYNDETIYNNYSDKIDRMPDMSITNFKQQLFVKNYWRINDELRDSSPCFYNESIDYVFNKLKYKKIFDDTNISNYNYDLINIKTNGHLLNNTNINWNSKKEFYELFGYAEEHIIWPEQKLDNIACVIYCHYDKNNIIKDYVIQSLKTLIILGYDILFCTSCVKINNIDLPFDIYYFDNKDLGKDFNMVNYVFNNNKNLLKYKWINLLNDSILLPIHGIENMQNTILNMRKNSDFWGLYESNEIDIHLCSNCYFEISVKCLNVLNDFYNNLIPTCNSTKDLIQNIELKQTKYLVDNGFKYNSVVSYKQLTYIDHCIMFNPININVYLCNKSCFGIKWKYLGNYIDYDKLNNPYLNYLIRFLKISNDIIPDIPNYFEYLYDADCL